jgi:hypothetical protein
VFGRLHAIIETPAPSAESAAAVELNDADVDRLIRQAARQLSRRKPYELENDDLHQIAALALLEARAAGAVSKPEGIPERRHAENWMRRKCVWAMLDGIREAFRQRSSGTLSLDDEDDGQVFEPIAPDDPERTAQLRQAVARLERKGSAQLIECARLLASGMQPIDVAITLAVSQSRISQLRAEALDLMDPCL